MEKNIENLNSNERIAKSNNLKLCKKLLDTEKEINKRKMLSSCFYKDDIDGTLLSSSNRSSKQSGSSGYYSMLPSARERIENQHYFRNSYYYFCELNNTVPKVKVDQDEELDFYGDRVRTEDWIPIIKAIENDKSLKVIRIRNRNLCHPGFSKDPAFYKRKILNSLLSALRKCLSESKVLNVIRLEAIPFSTINLKILLNGIERNKNLQYIELPFCSIGNKGCEMLCTVLRYKTNVKSLDLSSCGITADGVVHISDLIKVQKLIRYGDCWKQSLRYRHPNPGSSSGLQRIFLNNNINLADSGFICIVNTLLDDLWITEIHCQNCGLTNMSAELAINLAKCNYFIKYIDIRRNQLIDSELVIVLEKLLCVNNASVPLQRSWNSESEIYETNSKNIKHSEKSDSYKIKLSSGRSYSSNKGSESSVKISRSNSSFAAIVPPLTLSRVQKSSSSKVKPTKQKMSDLLQTKKDLREAKLKLFEEISKRKAAEKYCKLLEMQLAENQNCVLIEKSVLLKLIQTFQEFSFFFGDITKNEKKQKEKSSKNEDACNVEDLKKTKDKCVNTNDLSLNLNELNLKTHSDRININDPKTKAQELFNELLKQSLKKID